MDYKFPKFNTSQFNCPFCDEFSHQLWCYYRWAGGFFNEKLKEITPMERALFREHNKTSISVLSTSYCQNCKRTSIWLNEKMIYP